MDKFSLVRAGSIAAAIVVLANCGSPSMPDAADGATDASPDAVFDAPPVTCDREFTFETGSPTGHAQPLNVSPGQARAGRLTAAQLPTDPNGLAVWTAGDFVLANENFAVIIEDAGPSDLYDPWGGKIIGFARAEGGRLVDASNYNEVIFGIGRYTLETTSVSVLRDGSDGGPAVVRAIGNFRPVPFIDEYGRLLAPLEYRDVRGAIDYELRPGSDYLDVYVTFEVHRATDVAVPRVLHAFFQRYRMPLFLAGTGFSNAMPTRPVPYVAFIDESGMSYAWFSADGNLEPLLTQSGFDGFVSPSFRLPACEQTRRHFARVVVSRPGLDAMVQTLARVQNTRLREIRGTVVESGGAPAAGVRVHATSMDGNTYLTRATTNTNGEFVLHVPDGQAVRLTAWRSGDAVVGPVEIPAATNTAMLRLDPTGTIRVQATEAGSGMPLPVRVQVIPMGELPRVPDAFGEQQMPSGRLHIAFPTDGVVNLRVPVGSHRVLVSRGYEYELFDTTVRVSANETVPVNVSLRRVVDTTGLQCGDFHIHTHRSPDATDTVRFKLATIAGDGLEIPVRSDHEFVADFQPVIMDMGLQHWMRGVPSLELTTFAWGHFGVVPLPPNPSMVNHGTFDWPYRRPPDVFAEVRRRPSSPTIIINHPRSGGTIGGYFEAAGYDPETGRVRRPEYWDEQFTAVEVFNDSDFESNRMGTVRDWFSLLRHGRRVFAVGSSDSHRVLSGSPVGYPRTCMYLGTDDPNMVTPEMVRDAAAQGRSTISGGIYVTATGPGDTGPGQTAMGVGPMATVRVTVQAAPWIQVDRLEVIVDGMTIQTIPMDASTADPMNPVVRLRRDIQVPVEPGGSYAVFVAHGRGDLSPVHPGRRPFGVTNPIFFRR